MTNKQIYKNISNNKKIDQCINAVDNIYKALYTIDKRLKIIEMPWHKKIKKFFKRK
jgi:hypothetical protein